MVATVLPTVDASTTTEGVVVLPAHHAANYQRGFTCDVTVPFQAGTGFRLESLDGTDFDAAVVTGWDYGDAGIRFFEVAGDEHGNVDGIFGPVTEVCINVKDRDAVGVFHFRYTDGLARFASDETTQTETSWHRYCSHPANCWSNYVFRVLDLIP